MGDLTGWPYWKVVSITGQAGAGTDYQVELEIGDSAGGDFHLKGHCTNFPQDIRITDDDGTTLLDHFVEDLTADPIVVHVEVKDDLGTNRDIRVYYGKSGETTLSNGTNTFNLYHDGPITTTHQSTTTFGSGYALHIRSKSSVETGTYIATWADQIAMTNWISYRKMELPAEYAKEEYDGSITTTRLGGTPDNNFHIFDIGKITGTAYYKRDDINDGTLATGAVATANKVINYVATTEIDWYAVRKFIATEPAFSSAGAEQSPGWTGKIIGVINPAKINGIDVANIAKVMNI